MAYFMAYLMAYFAHFDGLLSHEVSHTVSHEVRLTFLKTNVLLWAARGADGTTHTPASHPSSIRPDHLSRVLQQLTELCSCEALIPALEDKRTDMVVLEWMSL